MRAYLKLLVGSVRSRFWHDIGLAVVIAIVAVALVSLQAILQYQAQHIADLTRSLSGADVVVSVLRYPNDALTRLKAVEGIETVEPALMTGAVCMGEPGYIGGLQFPSQVFSIEPNIVSGTYPQEPFDVLIPQDYAEKYGLKISDVVPFAVQISGSADYVDASFRVSGIAQSNAFLPKFPLVSMATLASVSRSSPNTIMIMLKPGLDILTDLPRIKSSITEIVPGAAIRTNESAYDMAQKQVAQSQQLLQGYSLLLLLSMAAFVWILQGISIRSSLAEKAGLMTIGVPRTALMWIGGLEVSLFALLGLGLAAVALPPVAAALARARVWILIDGWVMLRSAIYLIVPTLIASLVPIARMIEPGRAISAEQA